MDTHVAWDARSTLQWPASLRSTLQTGHCEEGARRTQQAVKINLISSSYFSIPRHYILILYFVALSLSFSLTDFRPNCLLLSSSIIPMLYTSRSYLRSFILNHLSSPALRIAMSCIDPEAKEICKDSEEYVARENSADARLILKSFLHLHIIYLSLQLILIFPRSRGSSSVAVKALQEGRSRVRYP